MRPSGSRGEDVAGRYLARRGWKILARNWSGGGGELDLVALRARTVAFVEVKTRADPGTLDDPVTVAQRARWINAARAFLACRPDLDSAVARFDVIAVDTSGRRLRIRHTADAFALSSAVGSPNAAVPAGLRSEGYSKSRSSVYATDRKERR